MGADPVFTRNFSQAKPLQVLLTDVDIVLAGVFQLRVLDQLVKAIHRIRKGSLLFLAFADELLRELALNRVIGIRRPSRFFFEERRVSGLGLAGLATVVFVDDLNALLLQVTRGS